MRGVIWANSFCSQDNEINLITDRVDGGEGSVTKAAEELWQWSIDGFIGYGRTVARGIRGTALDTFRRWWNTRELVQTYKDIDGIKPLPDS